MRHAMAAAVAALVLVWGGAGPAAADTPHGPRPVLHETTSPSPSHDMSDMTDEEMADMDGMDHDGSGGASDSGGSTIRTTVLVGFAAVNAGVLGAAVLLRRRDRRHPRHPARAGRSAS